MKRNHVLQGGWKHVGRRLALRVVIEEKKACWYAACMSEKELGVLKQIRKTGLVQDTSTCLDIWSIFLIWPSCVLRAASITLIMRRMID